MACYHACKTTFFYAHGINSLMCLTHLNPRDTVRRLAMMPAKLHSFMLIPSTLYRVYRIRTPESSTSVTHYSLCQEWKR